MDHIGSKSTFQVTSSHGHSLDGATPPGRKPPLAGIVPGLSAMSMALPKPPAFTAWRVNNSGLETRSGAGRTFDHGNLELSRSI